MDSKLTFRIQEIPEGISSRSVVLEPEDLEFRDIDLVRGELDLRFERRAEFIDVRFKVHAVVSVVCDRTLEPFETTLEGNYEVVFQPEVESVSETEHSKVKQINIDDLSVSIDEEVRDTLLLELPIKKVHPRFLDEEGKVKEFETKKFGSAAENEDEIDPRWEKLKKLKQ